MKNKPNKSLFSMLILSLPRNTTEVKIKITSHCIGYADAIVYGPTLVKATHMEIHQRYTDMCRNPLFQAVFMGV